MVDHRTVVASDIGRRIEWVTGESSSFHAATSDVHDALVPLPQIAGHVEGPVITRHVRTDGNGIADAAVAEKTGLTKKDAEKALCALIETVKEEVAKNEKVQLIGFGTFEVRDRKAKEAINPATKEKIQVPAKKAPAFKAGKALKDAVDAK